MTHIIRHHYLHVDLNGTETDGMALQRQLSAMCHHWLIPVIERVLDRYAPTRGHLVIDRLDIDAGTLNLDRLEHDIAVLVEQALEQSLRLQTPPADTPVLQPSRAGQRKTDRQTVYEAFIYFLQTGTLPWSYRLPVGMTLEQALLSFGQEEPEAETSWRVNPSELQSVLMISQVRQRLARQFSTDFLHRLLGWLAPALQINLLAILNRLAGADVSPEVTGPFKRKLWETALSLTATRTLVSEMQLMAETRQSLPEPLRSSRPLQRLLDQYWPGSRPQADLPEEPSETGPYKRNTDIPVATPEPDAYKPAAPTAPTESLNLEEGLYLDNAGLVILHPFLPRFFSALGIADDERLLQPERALCLLHFLATGQPVAPEHELTLPKLLCNIPQQTPVEADVALTEIEMEEANGLLRAVVHHWDALRNTSPDALRGTFLVRPGKLSLRSDDDWLLQVESQPYDILLDQLPWSISMLKLPWMPQLLRVEWR